jgi:hypothetical protein
MAIRSVQTSFGQQLTLLEGERHVAQIERPTFVQ